MAEKSLMDKISQGRQYRNINLKELRTLEANGEEESFVVEGYATTFNEPYTLYNGGDWELREQVDPNAFAECDMSDVIVQFDHEGKVFARTSNKTLELFVDNHGLKCRIDLSGSEERKQLYRDVKDGYITKMSFGFTVAEDTELRTKEDDKEVYLRTITKINKLYDVSLVSIPANDGTSVSARSLIDGVIDKRTKEISEAKEAEEKRQKEEEAEKEKKAKEKLLLEMELALSLSN